MTNISRRHITAMLCTLPLASPALAQDRFAGLLTQMQALDQLSCVVVAQNGVEVFTRTQRGGGPDALANVKSVSKSIVAALLGAAIDRGIVPGVDATLADVAPSLIPARADPAVAGITLEDLVTLRAGLERTSGANYGGWVASSNWVANALSRPMVEQPGGQMLYSTGSTHILGAALATASGKSLLSLARDWLGTALGIEIPAWTRDPQGFYLGGNEMALTPRAMLTFGEMYRTGGAGVLSRDWVTQSWVPRTRSPFSRHDYGYGWFLTQANGHEIAYARGYGGQMIYVVPDMGVTVAITSDPTRPARSAGYGGALNRLLADSIIPALT